ncbi:hypothetical protein F4561_005213 [Lipingzhangella halophila]|uniref:Uncharacterized protein n=1 Tax=Lipingzhangella halophila TaxID=1783352 RepID=A0A7W7W571_9ACTN|nr:hypothetical protein [Lipingzhangella halophila]MBB4934393.1 hypothetical protein [Lipingzhangella halophila]
MNYVHPIVVTADHVRALRDAGSCSLLIWHDRTDRVLVTEPGHIPGVNEMIIAGSDSLPDMIETIEECGEVADDARLAEDLSSIAGDWKFEWPDTSMATSFAKGIRCALGLRSIYVSCDPSPRGKRLFVDTYKKLGYPRFLVKIKFHLDGTGGVIPVVVEILSNHGLEVLSLSFRVFARDLFLKLPTFAIAAAVDEALSGTQDFHSGIDGEM